ncbi:MAG: hypothetical protein KBE91_00175 [Bacteroidia bacterium]|nr:hypothetical protein [Bacteroidia bacterium]MBP9687996.1 hypothetical protein [Bacteroidia bacterium]
MSINLTNKDAFLAFTSTELLIPADEVLLASTFRTASNWSSLNALIYISRINEETEVLITSSELAELNTFEDIFQLIVAKTNGNK